MKKQTVSSKVVQANSFEYGHSGWFYMRWLLYVFLTMMWNYLMWRASYFGIVYLHWKASIRSINSLRTWSGGALKSNHPRGPLQMPSCCESWSSKPDKPVSNWDNMSLFSHPRKRTLSRAAYYHPHFLFLFFCVFSVLDQRKAPRSTILLYTNHFYQCFSSSQRHNSLGSSHEWHETQVYMNSERGKHQEIADYLRTVSTHQRVSMELQENQKLPASEDTLVFPCWEVVTTHSLYFRSYHNIAITEFSLV